MTMTPKSKYPRAFVDISHSPLMFLPNLKQFGSTFRDGLQDVRNFVSSFSPDLVVMFAPDHMNLFERLRPPFTIILSGRTMPEFGVGEMALNIDTSLGADACSFLAENEIDIAAAEQVMIDHGLSLSLIQLFDEPENVPLLPLLMNVINFPISPLMRSSVLGTALGSFLSEMDKRILFIGTGGLSHNPPFPSPVPGARKFTAQERDASLSTASKWISPSWDIELIKNMEIGNVEWFRDLSQKDLDEHGCGANEIRTWLAAWAASGYIKPTYSLYEPVNEWITGMGIAMGTMSEN